MNQPILSCGRGNERGNILVGILITIILVLGLIFASTTISNMEIKTSRRQLDEIKAYYSANIQEFSTVPFVEPRHILISTEGATGSARAWPT